MLELIVDSGPQLSLSSGIVTRSHAFLHLEK